jgi:hypothetical protein
MNWKNEAMDRLRQYDAMRLATMNIPQEIKRLEADSVALRGVRTDHTAVLSGNSRREEAILDNMMSRQELRWRLEQAESWLSCTDRALDALSGEEKLVLQRFYISPEKGSVERLCSELGLESSSVYRKRDKALRHFTVALYGSVEH